MSVQSISQKKRLLSIALCAHDERKPASGTGTLLPAKALGRLMARKPILSDLDADRRAMRRPGRTAAASGPLQ
jgi:hypothetical protein